MRAAEGWMRRELHRYALVLHQLAYSLPNGAGERDLLQLSEQMTATAEGRLTPAEPTDAGVVETVVEPGAPTIAEIRAVIPEWPDTNGIPWRMCRVCHVVYDPTAAQLHDHLPPSERRRKAVSPDIIAQARHMVIDRFGIDILAASALLQKLSTAANTSVEHVARWLVGIDQPEITTISACADSAYCDALQEAGPNL